MFVKINGNKIEVGVSEGGVFHDLETKTVSANTLKGLKKKLQEKAIPVAGIPVVISYTGQAGMVTGRVKTKGYRRRYVIVRLESGQVRQESTIHLVRIATPDESALIAKLEAEVKEIEKNVEKAREPLRAAESKLSIAKGKLSMQQTIDNAFPENE